MAKKYPPNTAYNATMDLLSLTQFQIRDNFTSFGAEETGGGERDALGREHLNFGGFTLLVGDTSATQLMESVLDVSSGGIPLCDLIDYSRSFYAAGSDLPDGLSEDMMIYFEPIQGKSDGQLDSNLGAIQPSSFTFDVAARYQISNEDAETRAATIAEDTGATYGLGNAASALPGADPRTLRYSYNATFDMPPSAALPISISKMVGASEVITNSSTDARNAVDRLVAVCLHYHDLLGFSSTDMRDMAEAAGLDTGGFSPRSPWNLESSPTQIGWEMNFSDGAKVTALRDQYRRALSPPDRYAGLGGSRRDRDGFDVQPYVIALENRPSSSGRERIAWGVTVGGTLISELIAGGRDDTGASENDFLLEIKSQITVRAEANADDFSFAGEVAEMGDLEIDDLARDVIERLTEEIIQKAGGPSMWSAANIRVPRTPRTYNVYTGVNEDPANPDRIISPTLGVLVLPKIYCNPNTRHVLQASLFSSGIPTIEMSLCTPFINLQFKVDTPAIDDRGKTHGNIISFLSDGSVEMDSPNWHIANRISAESKDVIEKAFRNEAHSSTEEFIESLDGSEERVDQWGINFVSTRVASRHRRTGMELFTSPQTLVNMDINRERTTPVIDPAAPFMSLDGVTIKEYSSGYGLIGFKKATVNITLHDRSRLGEIAQFIAPRTFGLTEAFLEFGWSHPNSDPATGSPWGIFLNSLRSVQKYRLIKGNYNMDQNGQVKITLEMGTTGGEDTKTTHVCTGDYVHISVVTSLIREVCALLRRTAAAGGVISEEVFDIQHLSPPESSSNEMIERALYDSLLRAKDMIHSGGARSTEVKETLRAALLVLGGTTSSELQSQVIGSTNTVQALLGSKLDNINPALMASDDPFIRNFHLALRSTGRLMYELRFAQLSLDPRNPLYPTDGQAGSGTSDESDEATSDDSSGLEDVEPDLGEGHGDWVSLGKVAVEFMGYPMSRTGRYDEVQMLFYTFNECAGALAGRPISAFPIRFYHFNQLIQDAISQNSNLTTGRLESIFSSMIGNGSHQAYGFKDVYRGYDDALEREAEANAAAAEQAAAATSGTPSDDQETPQQRAARDLGPTFNLNEKLSERMWEMGLFRPRFKIPRLKIIYEAVPFMRPDGSRDISKTLLRIHLMDQNASTHIGEQLILDCITGRIAPSFFQGRDPDARSGAASSFNSAIQGLRERAGVVFDRTTQFRSEFLEDPNSAYEGAFHSYLNGTDAFNQFDALETFLTDMDRDFIHNYIKSRVPYIPFGTSNSPFSNVTISGMSSGALFNALLSRTFREPEDNQTSTSAASSIDEVTVVPATAKVSGLGNPMFHYGQQFYLDLKTGTTADNIFTVRDVTHNIGPGKFTTDLSFYPSGQQATVDSIRTNTISTLNLLDSFEGRDGDNNPLRRPVPDDQESLLDHGLFGSSVVGHLIEQAQGKLHVGNERLSREARREEAGSQASTQESRRAGMDAILAANGVTVENDGSFLEDEWRLQEAGASSTITEPEVATDPMDGVVVFNDLFGRGLTTRQQYDWMVQNDEALLRAFFPDSESLPTYDDWHDNYSTIVASEAPHVERSLEGMEEPAYVGD